jgi:hypothetical protein
MAKMMKKAEYGTAMGPKKPVAKKPMAPAPKKKKSYPILSDDGENYNGPKVGPREKTPGGGFSRNGSKIKKAKNGGAFGMLSVKAGIDKNPNPTAADRIAGATKKAKSGASMKKCKYGCK